MKLGWLDFEKKLFLAFFDFYFWWFYPKRLSRAIRTTGNIVLGIHMLSVCVVGGMLTRHFITMNGSSIQEADSLTQQIIKNTGRIDRLEDQQRTDLAFETEIVKEINDVKLQASLLQQELMLYRWAFGLIFVVLVGQLGVAVFSVMMRREADRRDLTMTHRHVMHDGEYDE